MVSTVIDYLGHTTVQNGEQRWDVLFQLDLPVAEGNFLYPL